MQAILDDLRSVVGVTGAIVCGQDGETLGMSFADPLDRGALRTMGKTLVQTLSGLELTRRRKVGDLDYVFSDGRVIVKNLGRGILVLTCARQVNVPLINLSVSVAVKRLQEMLKQAEGEPVAQVQATGQPSPMTETAALPSVVQMAEAVPEAAPPAPTLLDRPQEALQLVEAAHEMKVILRVIGELAVRMRCPTARSHLPPMEGEILEFACRGRQRGMVEKLLKDKGFAAVAPFNALYGNQRLRFVHSERGTPVEVFLDALVSYHQLDFGGRLHLDETTMGLADLLLCKLQIVFPTDRDLRHACAILADHDLGGAGAAETIDAMLITSLCAEDWGWYKTISTNLGKCTETAKGFLQGETLALALKRMRRLEQMIDEAPKSLRWQMRARIGERQTWYETPE